MTFLAKLYKQTSSFAQCASRCVAATVFTLVPLSLFSNVARVDGFTYVEGNPVLPSRGTVGFDSRYIDPGALIFHESKFHMFYPALPSSPPPLATGYATSEDGINWTRERQDPVLRIEDTGMDGYGVMTSSALVTDEGKWVLYFTLVPKGRNFTGSIARATADSSAGPWTTDSKLSLTPGPDGAWDAIAIGHASVIRVSDGYLMFYTGIGSCEAGVFTEDHECVGLARSTDGLNWVKHDDPTTVDPHHAASDPVLRVADGLSRPVRRKAPLSC